MPNLRLHKVQMENLMRLTSLEVEFDKDDHLIVVGGRNAQGKTSFMDGIENAFSKGKPSERPIHDGAKEAADSIWLCDDEGTPVYIVRKVIRKSKTEYTLADAQTGEELPGLWEFVDSLTEKGFGYDPAMFAAWGKSAEGRRKQFETLRNLAGLDFSELDAEHERVKNERTGVNKVCERLNAQLTGAPHFKDAPKEPVDVAELQNRYAAAQLQHNELERLRISYTRTNQAILAADTEIARLKELLAAKEEEKARMVKELQEIQAEGKAKREAAVDPAPIMEQLQQASETNRQVEANARREALKREAGEEALKAERLTKRMEAIGKEKADRMKAAQMPLPDLELADDGETVLYRGKPLNVASSAEQLRVSTSVGIATLKRLKMLIIRNGSFLDRDSRRAIAEMAREHKVQVFMEVVGTAGASFVIEDGELADPETVKRLVEEEKQPA